MDNNDLKERDFEAYIEHWLTTEGGYTKGDQSTIVIATGDEGTKTLLTADNFLANITDP